LGFDRFGVVIMKSSGDSLLFCFDRFEVVEIEACDDELLS
jgi:hypothetical protein